ncbi:alkene reductase [Singulisphaera rosea]
MSRLRGHWPSSVPSDLMLEYYSQRASAGGLLITEATAIAPNARGSWGMPAIYNDEQVAGWKRITDAVHAKGGYMFSQIFHAGRTSHISLIGEQPLAPSVVPAYCEDPEVYVAVADDGFVHPSPHRALETVEIPGIVEEFRAAAVNAKRAGFDGVEVMSDNGQLLDQFLQDSSNKRTDHYGGSVENRSRILFDVLNAVIPVWGSHRVGVRLSPSGTFNGMTDSNPRVLFRSITERLNDFGLAYLHIIEPRVKGHETIAERQEPLAARELSKVFSGPVIAAGGFRPETARAAVANGDASLVAFGRHFISNPDLPKRIRAGIPLTPYDRSTFYTHDARGYTDYPPAGSDSAK